MLRIGLFGAGRIGRMHAKNLAAHDRVELVGIYDVDRPAPPQRLRPGPCPSTPSKTCSESMLWMRL